MEAVVALKGTAGNPGAVSGSGRERAEKKSGRKWKPLSIIWKAWKASSGR